MVADLQRASAPYMPQLRSLMALPGAQQARADLLKGLQASDAAFSPAITQLRAPAHREGIANMPLQVTYIFSTTIIRCLLEGTMFCVYPLVPAGQAWDADTDCRLGYQHLNMHGVLLTQERMMARTVKLLFGGGPDSRPAVPAQHGRGPDSVPARERSHLMAPVNQSAVNQRTPTARGLSVTASGASV